MKLQDIKNLDRDDFLGLLGLESKHSLSARVLGTMGPFGIGLLVGAGVALLLAPKAGSDLRHDLRAKLHCDCKGDASEDNHTASTSREAHHQA
jgi:hypothetical protein